MSRETTGRVRVNVYIDEQILNRLDLMFFDPARGKSAYGARSDFIERLLREYFAREDQTAQTETETEGTPQ